MTLTVRCEAEHICPPSTHSFHPSLTPILLALLPTVPPRPLIPNSLPGCWELDWLPFYCLIFLLQRSSSSRHSSSSSSSSHNFDHHNHKKNDQVFTIGDQFNLNPHLRLIDRGSGNKSPSLASQVNPPLPHPGDHPFPQVRPQHGVVGLVLLLPRLHTIPPIKHSQHPQHQLEQAFWAPHRWWWWWWWWGGR